MADLREWLGALGLEQYTTLFAENGIDVAILPDLSDADLEKMGVLLGHRKKILRAIKQCPPDTEVRRRDNDVQDVASELRQITVLFSDLVDSTALAEKMDAEDYAALLRRYHHACADIIGRYRGHVAKYLGDGVMAYFGYGQAHEDDVERAVHAGLEIAEQISKTLTAGTTPLHTRTGIATGQVVVGDFDDGLVTERGAIAGRTPNLAARLQALAAPDTVVVGESSKQILGSQFEFEALGELSLKGIAEPVPVWCVLGEAKVPSRFDALRGRRLSGYVGRQSELALLKERWETATDGEGQAVLISGEAGIGKSRIVRHFQEHIADQRFTTLLYQCSPLHANVAFHPIVAQLERAAKIDRRGAPLENLDRLKGLLAVGMYNVEDNLPLFADLLGLADDGRYSRTDLSPERRRELILSALIEQLAALTRKHPVLLIFEDLHWSDESTLELLYQVLGDIASYRVLIIMTSRPTGVFRLSSASNLSQLQLVNLNKRQSAALVREVAGSDILPDFIIAEIVARSDGVPLYIEEVTKAVVEGGGNTIPASLQDSLAARLDRLGPAKEIAQLAAVIGRSFDRSLLFVASEKDASETETALEALCKSEIVFARSGDLFEFKHALLQDAAYRSLLRDRRRELHQRIADTIEREFPEQAEADPGMLGDHFRCAENWIRALPYLIATAKKASRSYANSEAVSAYDLALMSLEKLEPTVETKRIFVDLELGKGRALSAQGQMDDAIRCFERARTVAEQLDDPILLSRMLNHLGRVHYFEGRFKESENFHQRALAYAEQADDKARIAATYQSLGGVRACTSSLEAVIEAFEKALEIREQINDKKGATSTLTTLTMTLTRKGRPVEAIERGTEALRKAAELKDQRLVLWAHLFLFGAYADIGRYTPAYAHRDAAKQIIEDVIDERARLYLLGPAYSICLDQSDFRHVDELNSTFLSLDLDTYHHELSYFRFRGAFALARLARFDEARQWLKEGLKIAAPIPLQLEMGWAHLTSAVLETKNQEIDWHEVVSNLESSLNCFEYAGAELDVGRSHLIAAELLLAHDRASAVAHANHAKSIFVEKGHAVLADRARDLIRSA